MSTPSRLSQCLWFDKEAEEAARFYVSLFPNARIGRIARYTEAGFEIHGRPTGSVMTVEFELEGVSYLALNGGPTFQHSEAYSICVNCDSQQEIDRYWAQLTEGGQEGPCGWLKDRFGVSWQIIPRILSEMLVDPDQAKVARVTEAFLKMKKFDIAELKRAFEGKG